MGKGDRLPAHDPDDALFGIVDGGPHVGPVAGIDCMIRKTGSYPKTEISRSQGKAFGLDGELAGFGQQ